MPEDATGANWVTASTRDKSTLTIASGAITPTLDMHVVAAESGTADFLDFIDTADIPGPSDYDGHVLVLRADTGDTITLRHNETPAGTQRALLLPGGTNIVLESEEMIALVGDSDLAAYVPMRGAQSFTTGADQAHTTTTSQWNNKAGTARQVLAWDGSAFVAAYLNAVDIMEPAQITSFDDGLGNTEIASSGTVTPNFTAAYVGTVTAATIDIQSYTGADPEVNPADYPITLVTPFTSYVGEPAINKETVTVGAVKTWRLAATINGSAFTSDHTLTFLNRKYFGPNSQAAALSSAQVLALDATGNGGSALDADYAGSWNVTTSGEYIWFAYRDALAGTPTFTVGGFPGGFTDMGTISHTNDSGFVETYRLWRSDNLLTETTTVVVT